MVKALRYGTFALRAARIDRRRAFQQPGVPVDPDAPRTPAVCDLSKRVLERIELPGYKRKVKIRCVEALVQAALAARYEQGCIRYSRDNSKAWDRASTQVVDEMVKAGLFTSFKSKRGGKHRSRLMLNGTIKSDMNARDPCYDPWAFAPSDRTYFVVVRDRKTKEPVPFDRNDPIAVAVQNVLATLNEVLKESVITVQKFDRYSQEYMDRRRIRPVMYAAFHNDLRHGGRIVHSKYGHQSLSKEERKTIQFDGQSSVELDFSGLHPRMLYHLSDIKYTEDPYALWGDATTAPKRLLAKQMLNSLINARSERAAISACNRAMSHKRKDGTKKTGKALDKARKLYDAWKETGIKFADLVPLVTSKHQRISHFFGTDAGAKLMTIEAAIAAEIIEHFVSDAVPILPVHDSFVVPFFAGKELRRVMRAVYRAKMGFWPVVKES